MSKIIAGFLGLVMVAAVVGGTAYALFSSTATASGVTFATGNAELLISPDNATYDTDYNFGGAFFTGLYPTQETYGTQFTLKNTSTSAISLALTAQLNAGPTESPPGSWNALKDVVHVGFDYYDGSVWVTATEFHTLNEWYVTPQTVQGGNLAQNEYRWYRMRVQVDNSGNEIAEKSLTLAVFTFTGTQL